MSYEGEEETAEGSSISGSEWSRGLCIPGGILRLVSGSNPGMLTIGPFDWSLCPFIGILALDFEAASMAFCLCDSLQGNVYNMSITLCWGGKPRTGADACVRGFRLRRCFSAAGRMSQKAHRQPGTGTVLAKILSQ